MSREHLPFGRRRAESPGQRDAFVLRFTMLLPVDPTLVLRLFQPEDAEELFAVTDANRLHLRRWLPWLDQTKVVASTERFIEFTRRESEAGAGIHCAVVERGDIVGVCGLMRIEKPNRCANIGYWLSEDAQGRGLATRSVAALSSYAFAKLNLNRLVIACATGNRGSEAVALRCGFRFEGVAREAEWLYDRYVDHRIHSRLRSDP